MMPIASVVIPAHNEAAVVGRCLDALLADAAPGEFEVIVAANGCTDSTLAVVALHSTDDVRVVETERASKIAALNLGDSSSDSFPRIYLDADVVLSTQSARALAVELVTGTLAATPRFRLDVTRSSRPARAYLRVWARLPVFQSGYVGSGCYALSVIGRSRFEAFPDVTNDDQFVNGLFSSAEKVTLADHEFTVSAPRTWRAIVRRSVRVSAGAAELMAPASASTGTRQFLLSNLRDPRNSAAVVWFVVTQSIVKLLALGRRLRGQTTWLRDETSRSPA